MEKRASIRQVLSNQAWGERRQRIDATLDLIDVVHGIGDLPQIPLQIESLRDDQGCYMFDRATGTPQSIILDRKAANLEMRTLHEIGHFIDHAGIGDAGRWASVFDQHLEKWRDAVDQSASVAHLREMLQKGHTPSLHNPRKNVPISRAHLRYLLMRHELFSRSYSQYIVTRSASSPMLKQLQDARTRSGVYAAQIWSEDDFVEIGKALDKLFAQVGWLK